MEEIEIYSSKKKLFLLLIGSLLFVVGGIYIFMNAENFTNFRVRSPLFIKGIGIASALFCSLGTYVSIKQLFTNQPILIIGRKGININPKKLSGVYIDWKNIRGFSELKI
jgi:hypothetical protein